MSLRNNHTLSADDIVPVQNPIDVKRKARLIKSQCLAIANLGEDSQRLRLPISSSLDRKTENNLKKLTWELFSPSQAIYEQHIMAFVSPPSLLTPKYYYRLYEKS